MDIILSGSRYSACSEGWLKQWTSAETEEIQAKLRRQFFLGPHIAIAVLAGNLECLSKPGRDGNVRNQGKTVAVFLTSLQLCLFLSRLKFFRLCQSSIASDWYSQNDAHVWGTTTPRSCQFHIFTCSFCLQQLVNCFTDVAVVVSRPGA